MESRIFSAGGYMKFAVILAVLLVCPVQGEEKKIVRISGASLLAGVVEDSHDSFDRISPNCRLAVSGATTGIGFKKLIDGDAEVAMMTRKATSEEAKLAETKGITLSSEFMGKIGLAIVTNSKNTVNELTMEQLARIYKGEINNWSQVGGPNEPVKVTARAVPETGSGVLFQEIVLNGAPYAKDAHVMNTFRTMLQVCAKSFAIGYVPTTAIRFDKLQEIGVKVIRVKRDANSEPYQLTSGVAKESSYPISVDFFLYWNSRSENPCIKGFAEFCEKPTQ
jgi:phosphate transport system substrate-binding protein